MASWEVKPSHAYTVFFPLINKFDFFLIQVSHTSTSIALSDKSKYPSLYRAIPTDFPAIQATIALLKMFNWTRVAIIGEKTPSGLVSKTHAV